MSDMERPSNSEERNEATQAPEILPYTCYLRGRKSMLLTNHRRHMLQHLGVTRDGVSLVHPSADAGPSALQ